MSCLQFAPPVTVQEAREMGEDFGLSCSADNRLIFERRLSARLLALETLLTKCTEAADFIAGFDQEAWDAWEIGKE